MSLIPVEHLNYDFHNNSCDEDKMCGHYTQMVWADTHRVGCAVHHCNDMEGLNWGKTYFLVCNYYPTGNYEGERPYVEGDWCSRCPENFQKCENNLCVADTVEEEDDIDAEDEDEFTEFPATTVPFLLPAEDEEEEKEEEEAVVPPPVTSDPHVPPATTAITPTTSTPRVTTTSAGDSEEIQPDDTPDPGTQPPEAPLTTLGRLEEVQEKMREKEEEEEEEQVEEIKPAEKAERDVVGKIFQKNRVTMSAASVCSPSVLLASLTAILTLRL
uniref:peptidase inhibitor 16-like n=1 Tax=Semicossyphus pulcher TaxID=241346 RepID=UPI0037E7259D